MNGARLAGAVLLLSGACAFAESPALVERAQWDARPARIEQMVAQPATFRHVTIHHTEAGNKPGMDEAARMRSHQNYHMDERRWGDVAYHFVIGPSGRIYEGRALTYQGDSGTKYDLAGHVLICLMGNFDKEEPTPEALASLVKLTADQLRAKKLDATTIRAHRDVAASNCPGEKLYAWLQTTGRAEIARALAAQAR